MGDNDSESAAAASKHYRQVVLMYEALDKEIDTLIMAYGGMSR